MPHLRTIAPKSALSENRFPFNVPVIRNLRPLETSPTVTFLVGENGSGKSTLREGIAAAAHLPTIGAEHIDDDPTLAPQRELGRALRLTWNQKVSRGFFLRAEDFFGFAKALSKLRTELQQRVNDVETEFAGRSEWAKGLARGPARNSLAEMERRYGVSLDENSHGQSFLKLFRSRFVPDGLYLLDEPEAPLSPRSQLALMSMIGDMVQDRAQFIIATHAPILLGYPGAIIYSFDDGEIKRIEYEELDHVVITKDFLNGRERFLKYL